MPISAEAGFEFSRVSVSTTAIGIAPAGSNAVRAVLTLETAQIRFRYDGESPSSAVGHIMDIGDFRVIEGIQNVRNFRAIRSGSTDGVLSVTLER